MRIGHLKLPDETRLQDLSSEFFHAVGLEFQPDRSCGPQELALIRDIPIEKDVEVFSEAKEVPVVLLFRNCAAEDITIKLTNAVPVLTGNYDRRMVSENYLCHDRSFSSASVRFSSPRGYSQ